MATNVELDETLMTEALRLGQHRSKRAVIEDALREYVQRHRQAGILELFGTVDYSPRYNYKKLRRRE